MKIKKIIALAVAAASVISFGACSDNSGKATQAGLNNIYENKSLQEEYIKNPDTFKEHASDYGMSEEEADDFVQNSEKWGVYNLDVIVSNPGKNDYTYENIIVEELEKEGIYISSVPANGELTLPGGATDKSFPVTIIVDKTKIDTVDLFEIISKLDISLKGYETPSDDSEVAEEDKTVINVENKVEEIKTETPEQIAKEVKAKRNGFIKNGGMVLESWQQNDLAFKNEASKNFDMDSETAASIIKKGSGWVSMVLDIEVENKSGKDITVYNIITENNGANSFWVSKVSLYGEYSLPKDAKDYVPVTVLFNAEQAGKSAEEIAAGLKMQLVYSETGEEDSYGNTSVMLKKTIDIA